MSATAAPARGTRPRNRRALIIVAATELFHRVGYARVGMSDIASAVNVGPSALYRHFRSKSELFVAAAAAAMEPTQIALTMADPELRTPLRVTLRRMAQAAITDRSAGTLWHREARHLPEEDRRRLRGELRDIGRLLAARLRASRRELTATQADLLAWSALAAVASISFHRLQLPAASFESLMYDLLRRVTSAELPPLPSPEESAPERPRLTVRSRREIILTAAKQLFGSEGFASVTIDDIGLAAGIAGPSVYRYFGSKQEILDAALTRGNEWLWGEASRALATAASEHEALDGLLRSYLVLAVERGGPIALLAELEHLPPPAQQRARRAQSEYVTEWVELLRVLHPQLDPTSARIQVQATLTVINDTTQTHHLRRLPGFREAIYNVATALLGL
jgi:AcrR family transcriptional regulator